MAGKPSTAQQLRAIADHIHDIADRFSYPVSRPISVTERLIAEVEGAAVDLRCTVRGRS